MECLENGLNNIADQCKLVLKDPKKYIKRLNPIVKVLRRESLDLEYKKLLYSSLLKVFRSVAPLYKIRKLRNIVKTKKDSLTIRNYDKELLDIYTKYIKIIVDDKSDESYIVACEIFRYLDHFNCADRVASKILRGTLMKKPIADKCLEILKNKIQNDMGGDVVTIILNMMLEYEYSEKVVEFLCDVTLLDEHLTPWEKKSKEIIADNKKDKKKGEDAFFKRERMIGKKNRKQEKKARRLQDEIKNEETLLDIDENFVQHKNIVDGLQRVFFTILKDKKVKAYKSAYQGLEKYKVIIRYSFLEGLYVLMNDGLDDAPVSARLYGIKAILSIYGESGYDFKRLVNTIYKILSPSNFDLSAEDHSLLIENLNAIFIKLRQPTHRAHAMISRLINYFNLRYVSGLRPFIKDICAVYDIDLDDFEGFKYRECAVNSECIDLCENNPFFEYFLYKEFL